MLVKYAIPHNGGNVELLSFVFFLGKPYACLHWEKACVHIISWIIGSVLHPHKYNYTMYLYNMQTMYVLLQGKQLLTQSNYI